MARVANSKWFRARRRRRWYGVWIHLHADLLYTAMFFRQEKLDWRKFFASYRRPKTFAVWARGGPKPFFAQWRTTIRKGFRMISDRGLRQDVFGRVQSMASTGTANKETGSGAIGGRDSRGPSGTTHLTGDTDSERTPPGREAGPAPARTTVRGQGPRRG
jgi:hypothetical protein